MKSIAAALLTVLSVALLAGCSTKAVESLEVGQCFDNEDLEATEIASVPIVECSELHDNEVFHEYKLEGDLYPGEPAIEEEAAVKCVEVFETYVGADYDTSILDYGYLFPKVQSWSQSDRTITCYLYHVDLEKLTGSAKGTAQ